MKNIILFLLMLILFKVSAQYNQWASGFTGTGSIFVMNIEVDSQGNTFIVGRFKGTIDFDPSNGNVFKTSKNINYTDGFLCKLNAFGKLIWVKQFDNRISASSDSFLSDLIIDRDGNLLVIGSVYDSDPSPFFSKGAPLIKLDLNGDLIRTNQVEVGISSGSKIKCASNGDIIIGNRGFILKLDSLANLKYKYVNPQGTNVIISDFDIDQRGNLFVIGTYGGSISICAERSANPNISCQRLLTLDFKGGYSDVFVSKYDSIGKPIWLNGIQGVGTDRANAIKISNSGDVIISGDFDGTIDLDPSIGKNYQTSISISQAFFTVTLSNSGNYIWGKALLNTSTVSPNYVNVQDFDIDNEGNIYLLGRLRGTIDVDPNSGVINITSYSVEDNFILKLSSTGSFYSIKHFSNFLANDLAKIKVKDINSFYVAGHYGLSNPLYFDLGIKTDSLIPVGERAVYLTKFGPCPLIDADIKASDSTTICIGSSVKLNASPGIGLTYQWQKNNIDIIGANSNEYIASSSGSYSVNITASSGCLAKSITKIVTVNGLDLTGPTNLCVGSALTLTPNITGGSWSIVSGAPNISLANGVITGKIAGTSVIKYTVNNTLSNCPNFISKIISVESAPVVTLSGSYKICALGRAIMKASVAGGVWGVENSALIVTSTQGLFRNPTTPATDNFITGITYTVKSALGACTTKARKTLIVRNVPGPTITVTAPKTSLKVNEIVTATATTPITATGVWSSLTTIVSATRNTLNTKTAAIKGLRVGSNANIIYYADDAATGCRPLNWLTFSVTAASSIVDVVASHTSQTDGVHIYPNPSNGRFAIENTAGATSVKLVDLSGRVIATQPINAGTTAVDFSGVATGKYMVNISGDNFNEVQSVVIE